MGSRDYFNPERPFNPASGVLVSFFGASGHCCFMRRVCQPPDGRTDLFAATMGYEIVDATVTFSITGGS